MKKFFSTLLLLVSVAFVSSQTRKTDSLKTLLSFAKEDTAKVMLLLRIADNYETNNQDSSVFYLEKSKELSDRLKFKKGIYHYYEQSAIVSFTKGDYQLSMLQTDDALKIARELKDSNLIINMLNNTGIVYQYLGQFDKQLEYVLKALTIVENSGKKEKLAGMYHNVANAYYNLSQFRKSADYCFLSIKVNAQIGGYAYINRAYASLGQNYASLKFTDSALYYYGIAAAKSAQVNDKYAEAAIYGFMANTYLEKGEFGQMLKVSETSLALSKQLQSNQMMASSLYNIAYAQYFNGNNTAAKKNINLALQIATSDSLKDELKNIYTILSFIAAREGDFKTSFWAKVKSDSMQSILLNEQVVKTTTELEKKYETEKKENLIKQLQNQTLLQQLSISKKNTLNFILAAGAATILVISLLYYRTYKNKQILQQQKIDTLETEKKLTATEAVLKGEEQERTRLAKDLHDGLGGMLSGIKYSFSNMKGNLVMTPENNQAFERSMDMLDSSIKEMRRVAHNMMPEALVKFGLDTALKDFCNEIQQTGALHISYQSIGLENIAVSQTIEITIYRIVQELVNNIMKHASAKNAIVQVTNLNGQLSITVEDDGLGFDTNILTRTKGFGWSSIQNRVEFLKGKLDVDSQTNKGTSVHIEINT